MALGVSVINRTAPPARGAPTDTGTLFVATKATQGTTTAATLVRSLTDLTAVYGPRAGVTTALYDYMDVFFREGGSKAYIGRYDTADDVTDGLALFGKGLGPGQVVCLSDAPGALTYDALHDHAAEFNRFALDDVETDSTVAEMVTLGGLAEAVTSPTYGAVFGPWVAVPGPAGVIGGSARSVPASAVVAALCQRVDNLGNPNRAAAGRDFPLQYATGYNLDVTDAERITLLDAGVNTFATVYGVLEMYGFQTPLPQNVDSPFWQANCSRARMWITAQAYERGENYMFKPIDGRGRIAQALKTDLDEVLLSLYQVDGLYGTTPAEAFATEVGIAVNTTETIAQGELHAVCEVRLSLHAKAVIIELVSVPVGATIGA